MGFRAPLDYNSVSHQIYMAGVELNDQHNDGFVTWEIKKDLYKLKFLLDDILSKSGPYVDEKEFLEEYSKNKVYNILRK